MFLIIPLLLFILFLFLFTSCVGEFCRRTLGWHLDETFESRQRKIGNQKIKGRKWNKARNFKKRVVWSAHTIKPVWHMTPSLCCVAAVSRTEGCRGWIGSWMSPASQHASLCLRTPWIWSTMLLTPCKVTSMCVRHPVKLTAVHWVFVCAAKWSYPHWLWMQVSSLS